jgi:hypothetical protein
VPLISKSWLTSQNLSFGEFVRKNLMSVEGQLQVVLMVFTTNMNSIKIGLILRSTFILKFMIFILIEELIWLRHNATSRKVTGSIPDEFIGFLN